MGEFRYDVMFIAKNDKERRDYIANIERVGYTQYDGVGRHMIIKTYTTGKYSTYSNRSILGSNYDSEDAKTALAIASIHSDNHPHVGEWMKVSPHSEAYQEGGYAKVVKAKGDNFSTTDRLEFDSSIGILGNRKATPEELIEFFKQKHSTEMKNLIGYRIIKDGPGFKKGLELTVRTDLKDGEKGYVTAVIGGPKFRVKFPDEILSDIEWFEPIYEEVIKSETVIIGSRNVPIMVNSKGTILTQKSSTPIKIEQLTETLQYLIDMGNIEISEWATWPDKQARFIRIGCESENNLFSISEIQKVTDLYYKLNPVDAK